MGQSYGARVWSMHPGRLEPAGKTCLSVPLAVIEEGCIARQGRLNLCNIPPIYNTQIVWFYIHVFNATPNQLGLKEVLHECSCA